MLGRNLKHKFRQTDHRQTMKMSAAESNQKRNENQMLIENQKREKSKLAMQS